MAIEQPPIKDIGLAAYLVRAFTALQDSIDSVKTFFVLGEVKNPQSGKLYFVKNATSQLPTEGLYFFNGTAFVKISDALSSAIKLGVSHADAYYGDLGKIAYDHSEKKGNPHGLEAKDIGLEKVNNTADKDKPISDATQAAINGFVPTTRTVNGIQLVANIVLDTTSINETFSRCYVSISQRDKLRYSASATKSGYLLNSDWTIFNGKQDALGFTPENIANKVVAWSSPTDVQYPSAKLVNDTFANYIPLSAYHLYFKGLFGTLTALNIALPTAIAGDYAQVDSGTGSNPQTYFWDASDSIWVLNSSSGSGAANTDALPEGSFNYYFTENRVRATLLTGFSSAAGTVGATDSIITAFNKVVGNIATKIGLASLSATSPISYNNTTGVFSIPAATSSVNGYLSSTDWASFNNKLSAFGSQTANFFYAAPNGSSGSPIFRTIVVADIPTLNQNTTGSAAKLTTSRTINGVSFDGTANITIIAEATHSATSKSIPVDADELAMVDSAASNALTKLTWANLKATLKTYFDTLYLSSWQTWTPTWTNITIGNAVVTGRYIIDKNKLVTATLDVVFGTTSSAIVGVGVYHSFTLPVNAVSRNTFAILGRGQAYTAQSFIPIVQYKTTSDVYLGYEAIASGVPSITFAAVGWINGNCLTLTLVYQAA